jgi:signal transduction histidine kinase/CheY-like chemotaxis protein
MLAENVGYNIQISIMLTQVFAVYIYIVQKLHIADYNTFCELQKNLHELKSYKKLVDDLIPNPILVIKSFHGRSRLLMANSAAKRLFKTEDPESLCERARNLKLISYIDEKPITLGSLIDGADTNSGDDSEDFSSYQVINESFSFEGSPHTVKFELKTGRITWDTKEGIFANIIVLSDVTLSERLTEMQMLQEKKDQMLATVSHDLRTPTLGIVHLLEIASEELAEKKNSSEKVAKYINLAIDSANSLLFLVNDILDSSQISKGKLLSLNIERTTVCPLIERIINLLNFSANKKGVHLEFKRNILESHEVLIDPNRFQQIIVNLLGNAIKFTENGSITLSLSKETYKRQFPQSKPFSAYELDYPYAENVPCLVIHVKDTGIGIKGEDLPRLFQAFGKIEFERNKQGVGLGLSISQQLAKLMAADIIDSGIKVTSVYGQGSHFWFPIELSQEETNNKFESILSEGEAAKPLNNVHRDKGHPVAVGDHNRLKIKMDDKLNKKIMLVDDDAINLLVLEKLLGKLNVLDFELASNGREAFQKLTGLWEKGLEVGLILMDLNMPIMNGLEASRIMYETALKKGFSPPAVVILTAESNSDRIDHIFLPQEIKEFASKPITLDKLAKLIQKYSH